MFSLIFSGKFTADVRNHWELIKAILHLHPQFAKRHFGFLAQRFAARLVQSIPTYSREGY